MSTENQVVDFASIIASAVHDMKNSLTLLLDSLDDAATEAEASRSPLRDRLRQAQHEGVRLNRNLIQLLVLYRMEREQMFINVTETYVAELLEEVATDHEHLLASQDIHLEIDCDDGLLGYFDRELVSGIVGTVVNNSYRYARQRIRLRGEQEDGYLVIRVEDDGPGYPAKMLHEGGGRTPVNFHGGSTGLGLYFAEQVARSHHDGGRQGYTQTDNHGIEGGGRFSLFLP